jgi:Arc/MetJ-type ribon-helix-helix transcriptional regulator
MTRKIAISLPDATLRKARAAVRSRKAPNVSNYIARLIEDASASETFDEMISEWIRESGATEAEIETAGDESRQVFERAGLTRGARAHGKTTARHDAPERPGLVLDAGALQALERRPIRLLMDLKLAHELGLPIRIPAGCIAQSWRDGPRSAALARLLRQPCIVVQVDERSAREVGEFIASVGLPTTVKPDITDAHVALTTRATGSVVWTSDAGDMERYSVNKDFIRRL